LIGKGKCQDPCHGTGGRTKRKKKKNGVIEWQQREGAGISQKMNPRRTKRAEKKEKPGFYMTETQIKKRHKLFAKKRNRELAKSERHN